MLRLEAPVAAHRVCIIGSGNWGSAISKIIGRNVLKHPHVFDREVHMWVFEEMVNGKKLSEIINTKHENVKYLPGIHLPDNVVAIPNVVEAAKDADVLVFVLPHQFVKNVCKQLLGNLSPTARAISLIKGLDTEKGLSRVSEIIRENLNIEVSVLMGANIAHEVAEEQFCETTIGCANPDDSDMYQKLFHTPLFRVTVVPDVIGVELCGALKNIVGVAAGFVDGLGYGSNTKAAIMRIGLLEMMRFMQLNYDGVKSETFFESCGMADLITTCAGGRNRLCAEAFVKSRKPIEQIEKEMLNGQKLQGPLAAEEVYHLLAKKGLINEFPLFVTVYRILFEGMPAERLVHEI
eukprot:Colp12_sorted_trinity150504_noHs@8501